jgi:hypothetical protein
MAVAPAPTGGAAGGDRGACDVDGVQHRGAVTRVAHLDRAGAILAAAGAPQSAYCALS